jgi:hypothetical protein
MIEINNKWIYTYMPQLRRLVAGFSPRRLRFDPNSNHLAVVGNKVVLAQVSSEYYGFPCQFSFHRLLHTHHHLSSGAGTVGKIVADVQKRKKLIQFHPIN